MERSTSRSGLRGEAGALLRLAGPLIANNLALAGNGFADTAMSGRIGAADVAAVAVGASLWMVGLLFVNGLILSVTLSTARSFGAQQSGRVGSYARQGIWIGLGCSVVLMFAFANVDEVLRRVGTDAEIVPLASDYLRAQLWGTPALCVYLSLSCTTEGLGRTRPVMLIALLGLAVNILGNYALMFGPFGLPALGAVGCGYATAIAMWISLLVLAITMHRGAFYRPFGVFARFEWPDRNAIARLLGLGAPIAVSFVAESVFFAFITLLISRFDATTVGGHQVALNYASVLVMVPLGISSAATIRVGHTLGQSQASLARRSGRVAISMCTLFMVTSALVLFVGRGAIVGTLYGPTSEVAAVAVDFLFIAAFLQILDALQIGAAGVLRGYNDTKVPMVLNLVAYWGIGAPVAWTFGVALELGPFSVWAGLAAGLIACALLLNARVRTIGRRSLAQGTHSPVLQSPRPLTRSEA